MRVEADLAVFHQDPGGEALVQSECLPFSRIPHTTPLFQAFLHDFPRVQSFYSRPPLRTDWLVDEAQSLGYDASRRARVAAILDRQNRAFGASNKTLENVDRLRRGASAVVTGQQVGLFGGPLFSVLKALTAVRLAEESRRAGADCVPVFWLATEDHDLAEVDQVVFPGSDGTLRTLHAEVSAQENQPVANIQFGAEIDPVVAQAAELLGDADAVDALRSAYRSGCGFGEAFARLFARLFHDFGVVLLDANDAELHREAAPLYVDAIRQAAGLDAALLGRGEALRKAGFHEQVKVTESSALLFVVRDGARTVIHRANGVFAIGKERLGEAELLEQIASAPERFSPNVLLRPVVQDFLLPTLAYVGGPAEVAYLAQAAVVYEKLLGRVTPAWPRISMTVVEPHAKRLLDRYHLSLGEVLREQEHLRALLAERVLPSELQHNFDAALNTLNQSLDRVTDSLARLDRTLVDAANRAGAKMRYQLGRLRGRAAAAEVRRNEVLARHASQLGANLFPHESLQERVIGGLYFLARYPDLLAAIHGSASLTCPEHQVLYLE